MLEPIFILNIESKEPKWHVIMANTVSHELL